MFVKLALKCTKVPPVMSSNFDIHFNLIISLKCDKKRPLWFTFINALYRCESAGKRSLLGDKSPLEETS